MRVAGVRLDQGSRVWLDAGELSVATLDRITAMVEGSEREGEVFVAPGEVIVPPQRIDGLLMTSHPPTPGEDDCGYLPGSEFPALGQHVQAGTVHGTVVALDPAERRVTIVHGDTSQTVISLDDITGE